MKKFIIYFSAMTFLGLISLNTYALTKLSQRIPQFSNHKVKTWQTIIYPSNNQKLPMHHHDHDRVVVVLRGGTLKVINQNGIVNFLKLRKGKAYYLAKNAKGEVHTDENISQHPIQVMVIELLDS